MAFSLRALRFLCGSSAKVRQFRAGAAKDAKGNTKFGFNESLILLSLIHNSILHA